MAIDTVIEHRLARESKVLSALAHGPQDLDALLLNVYADTEPARHSLARLTLLAHLHRLELQQRVVAIGREWTLTA